MCRVFYPDGALNLPGAVSLLVYLLLAGVLRASNAPRDVASFLLVIGVLFGLMAWAWRRAGAAHGPRATRLVGRILLFAALFRLAMLAVGLPSENRLRALGRDLGGRETGFQTFLLYDNDVWRYLWDGHLTATGIGPYSRTPHELLTEVESGARGEREPPPLETELWWDVLDNVSFRTYTSVYPPAAQELFLLAYLIAPGSVLVLKLLIALVDLGCCLAVAALVRAAGRPDRDLLFYAWNPLVIKEFAGSGHVDALMILFVAWAAVWLLRRRDALAQLLLGVGIASKLGAVILLPLFWRHTRPATWLLAPLAAAAVSLPFASGAAGLWRGLGTYAREWVFNSGPWLALQSSFAALGAGAPGLWAHLVTKGVVIAVVIWSVGRGRLDGAAWARAAFLTLAALVVLNPAVMPWYLTWALPFAIATGNRSWILFTALCFLSYLFYIDRGVAVWWLWAEYGLFFAAVAWESAGWPRSSVIRSWFSLPGIPRPGP